MAHNIFMNFTIGHGVRNFEKEKMSVYFFPPVPESTKFSLLTRNPSAWLGPLTFSNQMDNVQTREMMLPRLKEKLLDTRKNMNMIFSMLMQSGRCISIRERAKLEEELDALSKQSQDLEAAINGEWNKVESIFLREKKEN